MSVYNFISQGQSTLLNTLTTCTLGVGPNFISTPGLLLQSLAAGGSVVLPKINQVGPTAPGTPGTTPGCGDGMPFTVFNLTAFPTTLSAASGDTLYSDVEAVVNGTGSSVSLIASASQSTWYAMNPVGLIGPAIRTVAGAATLQPSDRFLIITTTAAAVTLQAPSNYQIGQLYSITNNTSGSLTLTPASGTIGTTTNYTLTTLLPLQIYTDGTNWQLS